MGIVKRGGGRVHLVSGFGTVESMAVVKLTVEEDNHVAQWGGDGWLPLQVVGRSGGSAMHDMPSPYGDRD